MEFQVSEAAILHDSEEINIYGDICDFDLGEEIEKLKTENKRLEDHIRFLEGDVEKLNGTIAELKETQNNLTRNISALFLTAKAEIERKDRMIAELRTQIDNKFLNRLNPESSKRRNRDDSPSENNKSKKLKYDEKVTKDKPDNQRSKSKENRQESCSKYSEDKDRCVGGGSKEQPVSQEETHKDEFDIRNNTLESDRSKKSRREDRLKHNEQEYKFNDGQGSRSRHFDNIHVDGENVNQRRTQYQDERYNNRYDDRYESRNRYLNDRYCEQAPYNARNNEYRDRWGDYEMAEYYSSPYYSNNRYNNRFDDRYDHRMSYSNDRYNRSSRHIEEDNIHDNEDDSYSRDLRSMIEDRSVRERSEHRDESTRNYKYADTKSECRDANAFKNGQNVSDKINCSQSAGNVRADDYCRTDYSTAFNTENIERERSITPTASEDFEELQTEKPGIKPLKKRLKMLKDMEEKVKQSKLSQDTSNQCIENKNMQLASSTECDRISVASSKSSKSDKGFERSQKKDLKSAKERGSNICNTKERKDSVNEKSNVQNVGFKDDKKEFTKTGKKSKTECGPKQGLNKESKNPSSSLKKYIEKKEKPKESIPQKLENFKGSDKKIKNLKMQVNNSDTPTDASKKTQDSSCIEENKINILEMWTIDKYTIPKKLPINNPEEHVSNEDKHEVSSPKISQILKNCEISRSKASDDKQRPMEIDSEKSYLKLKHNKEPFTKHIPESIQESTKLIYRKSMIEVKNTVEIKNQFKKEDETNKQTVSEQKLSKGAGFDDYRDGNNVFSHEASNTSSIVDNKKQDRLKILESYSEKDVNSKRRDLKGNGEDNTFDKAQCSETIEKHNIIIEENRNKEEDLPKKQIEPVEIRKNHLLELAHASSLNKKFNKQNECDSGYEDMAFKENVVEQNTDDNFKETNKSETMKQIQPKTIEQKDAESSTRSATEKVTSLKQPAKGRKKDKEVKETGSVGKQPNNSSVSDSEKVKKPIVPAIDSTKDGKNRNRDNKEKQEARYDKKDRKRSQAKQINQKIEELFGDEIIPNITVKNKGKEDKINNKQIGSGRPEETSKPVTSFEVVKEKNKKQLENDFKSDTRPANIEAGNEDILINDNQSERRGKILTEEIKTIISTEPKQSAQTVNIVNKQDIQKTDSVHINVNISENVTASSKESIKKQTEEQNLDDMNNLEQGLKEYISSFAFSLNRDKFNSEDKNKNKSNLLPSKKTRVNDIKRKIMFSTEEDTGNSLNKKSDAGFKSGTTNDELNSKRYNQHDTLLEFNQIVTQIFETNATCETPVDTGAKCNENNSLVSVKSNVEHKDLGQNNSSSTTEKKTKPSVSSDKNKTSKRPRKRSNISSDEELLVATVKKKTKKDKTILKKFENVDTVSKTSDNVPLATSKTNQKHVATKIVKTDNAESSGSSPDSSTSEDTIVACKSGNNSLIERKIDSLVKNYMEKLDDVSEKSSNLEPVRDNTETEVTKSQEEIVQKETKTEKIEAIVTSSPSDNKENNMASLGCIVALNPAADTVTNTGTIPEKSTTSSSGFENSTIQNTSPNCDKPKLRKRITPTPVRDEKPLCSFENILTKTTQSNTFPTMTTMESPLHLTHEGEIPVLHLEENHINNMPTEVNINDKNIINLLDTMNISNIECEIPKFKNISGETTTNSEATAGNTISGGLTFQNVIEKVTSTSIKSVATREREDVGVTNSLPSAIPHSTDSTSSLSSNTQPGSFQRRRRRCRLVIKD